MSPPSATDSEYLCPPTWLNCYKDCCERGQMYCDHKEERCKRCRTQEKNCHNITLLPQECDAFCAKLDASVRCADTSEMVHPAYFWATCILAVVVTLMVAFGGVHCYRKRRHQQHRRHRNKAVEAPANAQSDSSLDSLLRHKAGDGPLSPISSEVTAPSERDYTDPQLSTLGGSTTFTMPSLGEPNLPPGDPTFEPDPAPDLSLPPGEPLTPPPTPPTPRPLTPSGESTVAKTPAPVTAPTAESLPLLGKDLPSSPPPQSEGVCKDHSKTSDSDSGDQACGKCPCRDPRLDNIIPSTNTDHIVSIHTGHGNPLDGGRGIRYTFDC